VRTVRTRPSARHRTIGRKRSEQRPFTGEGELGRHADCGFERSRFALGEVLRAGTKFGVQEREFAEVIAGDDNRAAYCVPGPEKAGDTQSRTFREGWHLYVASVMNPARPGRQLRRIATDRCSEACIVNQGGSKKAAILLDVNGHHGGTHLGGSGWLRRWWPPEVALPTRHRRLPRDTASAQDALATMRASGRTRVFRSSPGTHLARGAEAIEGHGRPVLWRHASGYQGDRAAKASKR